MESIFESILQNTVGSISSESKKRKRIFKTPRPNEDSQEPKLMLNGQNIQTQVKHYYTDSVFNLSHSKMVQSNIFTKTIAQELSQAVTPVFQSQVNRNFGQYNNNINTSQRCVRPVSFNKPTGVYYNPPTQINVIPPNLQTHTILTNSRVLGSPTNPVLQPQRVLSHSNSHSNIIIPHYRSTQQATTIIKQPIISRVIIKQQPPIHNQIIIKQTTVPQVTKVVIQDDPKTISQMNKLTLLNQYLNNQYSLTNNQLNIIKQKIYLKQFIQDKTFLQKSLNTIDDIFLKQTNEALFKLDQINRKNSNSKSITKTFTRSGSSSCLKSAKSGFFNKTLQKQNVPNILLNNGHYSPIKQVQHSRMTIFGDNRY